MPLNNDEIGFNGQLPTGIGNYNRSTPTLILVSTPSSNSQTVQLASSFNSELVFQYFYPINRIKHYDITFSPPKII